MWAFQNQKTGFIISGLDIKVRIRSSVIAGLSRNLLIAGFIDIPCSIAEPTVNGAIDGFDLSAPIKQIPQFRP